MDCNTPLLTAAHDSTIAPLKGGKQGTKTSHHRLKAALAAAVHIVVFMRALQAAPSKIHSI